MPITHEAEDFTLEVGGGNGVVGSGTPPQIAFWSTSGQITGDDALIFPVDFVPNTGRQLRMDALGLFQATLDATRGAVTEAFRFVPRVLATHPLSGTGTYFSGVNVTSANTDGTDVSVDGYYAQLNINAYIKSPIITNEVSALGAYCTQTGIGSAFSIDCQVYTAPYALAKSPNIVGANIGVHNDFNGAGDNDPVCFGIVLTQSSRGKPLTGNFAYGMQIQRATAYDYANSGARTVTTTNGVATVTIANGNWQTLEETYDIDITGKKIYLADGVVYTILSVDSAAQITLTALYGGAGGAGEAFVVRVAEPWTKHLVLAQVTDEGLRIEQDPYFRPTPTNYAFVSAVAGTRLSSIDFAGLAYLSGTDLRDAAPSVAAGHAGFGATHQATVGVAGGATNLPVAPDGYLIINVEGTNKVIPYFAAA